MNKSDLQLTAIGLRIRFYLAFVGVCLLASLFTFWSAHNYRLEAENEYLRGEVGVARMLRWDAERKIERDRQRVIEARSKKRLTKDDVEALVGFACPDWTDAQVGAMVEVCWRESRYYAKCQDPRSSASGLFGFLDSTYRNYGYKTHDPLAQTIMAVRYTQDRYGSPEKAKEFWDENNWY